MNRELPDVQSGFRKGRGTRDQIANIRWNSEKAREFQKNIYFCFIDYAKASDYVDHNKLENSERDGHTRPSDLPLEKPQYAGQEATVRNGHGTTGSFYLSKVRFLNLEESHLQKLVLKQLGCKNTDVMNGISQYLGISESYPFNFSIHIFFDSQNVEFQRHNKITFSVWITSKKRSFFCQVQTSHYQAQSKIRLPEFPSANGMFTMI